MYKRLNFGGDPDHGSGSWIRITIATLVRRALAEICAVPVLLVMAALWNRQAIIFLPCDFLLSSSSFSSPNLSGRRLDVYHTSTHGVALVRI